MTDADQFDRHTISDPSPHGGLTMSEPDELAKKLLTLYRGEIRGLLEEHQISGLDAADRTAEVVERAQARKTRLDFGFLGASQVGKSTLINALVGQSTLPSGGIGPLTAQATEVAYADENSISVRYHTRQKLNQLAFAMERYLIARGDLVPAVASSGGDGDADDELALDQIVDEVGGTPRKSERGEAFLKQAQLMLTGMGKEDPLSSIALLEGIRAVLGSRPGPAAADALAPHQARIEMLRAKCQTTERLSERQTAGRRGFEQELHLRAAGSLAPLVAELKVELKTPFLRHVTLIDLPGIGIVGDPAGRVAERFVRTRGDALIVVIKNSGVSSEIAALLERTGVISKLLFGAAHGDLAIHVLVAVTHLDDVARTRYADAVRLSRDTGELPPDRQRLFETLAEEMRAQVRSQVESALRSSSAYEDLPPEQKVRRDAIVSQLCSELYVAIVAANDFLHLSDGLEDLAFLRDLDATGIPGFRQRIQTLSSELARHRDEAILRAARDLHELLDQHLDGIAQIYDEGGGRASAEWQRFRVDLGAMVAPLREQMRAHQGEVISTLGSTLPVQIALLCKTAEMIALKKLERLRRRGEAELHFQSLQAALRNSGVWDRRSINYPDAITRAYVDSIASDWEPTIIEGIRSAMRTLADREVALVEQVCAHAASFDERIVADAHIDTQKKLLLQQSRACLSWTRERLEKLREDVQLELVKEVGPPIEKAALDALKAGKNVGSGAKRRILDAFQEGGEKAIERASARALKLLKEHYDKIYVELQSGYLREHHDPLQSAHDALTKDELVRARRSDAQLRRRVLEQVAVHRGSLAALQPG
jgi:hypothetical protein